MKEFIEKLIERLEEKDDDCGCGKIDVWDAISIVNQLSEEYNNGWIPCSERLPEENVCVLVQINFKDCIKMAVTSRMDFNYWTGFGRDVNVIAWMPLPEPWIGE